MIWIFESYFCSKCQTKLGRIMSEPKSNTVLLAVLWCWRLKCWWQWLDIVYRILILVTSAEIVTLMLREAILMTKPPSKCHQHISSPTSVTNSDVRFWHLAMPVSELQTLKSLSEVLLWPKSTSFPYLMQFRGHWYLEIFRTSLRLCKELVMQFLAIFWHWNHQKW